MRLNIFSPAWNWTRSRVTTFTSLFAVNTRKLWVLDEGWGRRWRMKQSFLRVLYWRLLIFLVNKRRKNRELWRNHHVDSFFTDYPIHFCFSKTTPANVLTEAQDAVYFRLLPLMEDLNKKALTDGVSLSRMERVAAKVSLFEFILF